MIHDYYPVILSSLSSTSPRENGVLGVCPRFRVTHETVSLMTVGTLPVTRTFKYVMTSGKDQNCRYAGGNYWGREKERESLIAFSGYMADDRQEDPRLSIQSIPVYISRPE